MFPILIRCAPGLGGPERVFRRVERRVSLLKKLRTRCLHNIVGLVRQHYRLRSRMRHDLEIKGEAGGRPPLTHIPPCAGPPPVPCRAPRSPGVGVHLALMVPTLRDPGRPRCATRSPAARCKAGVADVCPCDVGVSASVDSLGTLRSDSGESEEDPLLRGPGRTSPWTSGSRACTRVSERCRTIVKD